jgi:hypothetical protein
MSSTRKVKDAVVRGFDFWLDVGRRATLVFISGLAVTANHDYALLFRHPVVCWLSTL